MIHSPLHLLPNTYRAFYGTFSTLHPAQQEAIDPILSGKDLILQAATGSGKSEAVLAPCMERVIRSGRTLSVLYIIPTRALAVDLCRRFHVILTEKLGLKVAIRTGDIKRRGGDRPDILFTTPESLDVMLGSQRDSLKAFLHRVGCIIIDEVHPLIHHYRGIHLTHLLTRLERRSGKSIQRIAMSATIAHVGDVMAAFHFKPFPDTCHIQAAVEREILARIIHLQNETIEFPAFLNDLHDTWHYRKILIFANSRGACDRLFAMAQRTQRFKGMCELHYSNLKPGVRKKTEKRFRERPISLCIATSTLELGIDVGDVDAVILYEPPDSVSAFLQRIGRANRRERKLNFWGICRGEWASRQVVRFLSLLRLGRQGAVEATPPRTLPSVMAQQVISCLYEKREISLYSIADLFPDTPLNRHGRRSATPDENNVSISMVNGHGGRSATPNYENQTGISTVNGHGCCSATPGDGNNVSISTVNTDLPPPPGRLSKTNLASLFHSLEKKGWIKPSSLSGLFSGGYQYGKHLTEYKIWGNFPESEEDYVLELTGGTAFFNGASSLPKTGERTMGENKGRIQRQNEDHALVGQNGRYTLGQNEGSPVRQGDLRRDPRAIADIPRSMVNQLAVGDRVYMVGRRLKILHIDHDTHKRIVAATTPSPPDKELIWLGMGAHVSYDVAQMMRRICHKRSWPNVISATSENENRNSFHGKKENPKDDPALFSRTRRLLDKELNLESGKVRLDNGIEIVPGRQAPRLYRTWLGSAGNLILEWSIRHYIDKKSLFITSHEVGIECSQAIRFEHLKLPESRKALESWVLTHLQKVRNLIPLNLFSRTLPAPLLAMEIADFLFDQRVLDAFTHYMTHTSEVISGDPSLFDPLSVTEHRKESFDFQASHEPNIALGEHNSQGSKPDGEMFFTEEKKMLHPPIPTPPSPSLLMKEKEKWCRFALPHLERSASCLTLKTMASVTATLVSDFILYGQCHRRFAYQFLRKAPPENNPFLKKGSPAKEAAIQQGIDHEKAVLAALQQKGNTLISMPTEGSATKRFHHFLETITTLTTALCRTDASPSVLLTDHKPEAIDLSPDASSPILLTQVLLRQSDLPYHTLSLSRRKNNPNESDHLQTLQDPNESGHLQTLPYPPSQWKIPAIGIPDLIVAYIGNEDQKKSEEKSVILEVGDIKSSRSPRYHQKWQVAFYAFLLQQIVDTHAIPAKVSSRGFLITRPQSTDTIYTNHSFDLTPYLKALPVLLGTLSNILNHPPSEADHRLNRRCTTCEGFIHCYVAALRHEDIQFLPNLTPGRLLKLRNANTPMIEDIPKMFPQKREERPDILSSEEKEWLMGTSNAFLNNQIFLSKRQTRHFPSNLSSAIFLHIIKDARSGMPRAVGWLVTDAHFNALETDVEIISSMKTISSVGTDHSIETPPFMMTYSSMDRDTSMEIAHSMETSHSSIETDPSMERIWEQISQAWNDAIGGRNGPHIFHFGEEIKRILQIEPSSDWSDLGKICTDHFDMALAGIPSLFSLADLFNCNQGLNPPESLFHQDGENDTTLTDRADDEALTHEVIAHLNTMAALFQRIHLLLESRWIKSFEKDALEERDAPQLGMTLEQFIQEERRLQEEEIFDLQERPLHERMERFRSLAYLKFQEIQSDHPRHVRYLFKETDQTQPSKFRKGDFLKLVPHGMQEIQSGAAVILSDYDMEKGEITLTSRSGRLQFDESLFYALEEDAEDFTERKLLHVSEYLFSESLFHPVHGLLSGNSMVNLHGRTPATSDHENNVPISTINEHDGPSVIPDNEKGKPQWIDQWLRQIEPGLNPSQEAALKLPFRHRISMIQGPPGTGKTHLLGWILIALTMEAFERGIPLRIGISALTHQAIDNVLTKVVFLANHALSQRAPQLSGEHFPAACIKWGKAVDDADGQSEEKPPNCTRVIHSNDADDVLKQTWSIVGATGFGFYHLFDSKSGTFPLELDWVIFDEASQLLLPQALLTLAYGKGNAIFLGDVHQLPPIVRGNHDNDPLNQSILSMLMGRYPTSCQITLNTTYRMNREICAFPSDMWYGGLLHPAPTVADARLEIKIESNSALSTRSSTGGNRWRSSLSPSLGLSSLDALLDPSKPIVLILTDHVGCAQKSETEAELMALLACELMMHHRLKANDIALISPHRAQNNDIMKRLTALISASTVRSPNRLRNENEITYPFSPSPFMERGLGGEVCGQVISDRFLNKEMRERPLGDTTIELPLVDTVERMQGAERDVILFGLTASDPDHIQSDFLNSPHRLNVAMTRAKKKLIIIGSTAFFSAIPTDERQLKRHHCFKALLAHCRANEQLFHVASHTELTNEL